MENNNYFMYSFLLRIKDFFKKNKDIVISTFVTGLIAHAYCFFNYLPTWDGIINTNTVGATFSSGRWLLKYVGDLFSSSTLSWTNGLLSILFISLSAIMIADIFSINDKVYRIILSCLLVTFPAVTSTFAFIFTADCYMLAFLFSVLAAYLFYKYQKFGFIAAIPLIAGSIGIYQSYLSVFLVLVTIMIISDTVVGELKVSELIKKYYKSVISFVAGFVLYEGVLKLFLKVKGIELSSYQGINEVGLLSPVEMLRAVAVSGVKLLSLYGIELFNIEGRPLKMSFYSVVCMVLLLATATLTIAVIVNKKLYKKPSKIFLLIVELFLMFVFSYMLRFGTVNVEYSAMMEMQICLYYVITIIFLKELPSSSKPITTLKNISLLAFCLLIISNSISSNVNYFYMYLRYERTYATAQKVIDDITEQDNFKIESQKVAVIGADFKTSDTEWIFTLPYIRGSGNDDTVLTSQNHYVKFWHYFLGIDVITVNEEEVKKIKATDEFQNMPCYPDNGYVREIKGITVAKISDK